MSKLHLLTSILFLTVLCFFYILYKVLVLENKFHANNTAALLNNSAPLFLFYTPLFNIGYTRQKIIKIFEKCEYRCIVSDNPADYPQSSVAIFHSRQMYMTDSIQKHSNSDRLNVFYTMEAYPHERIKKRHFPKNFFNITMTFRRDSTICMSYGVFEKILPPEENDENIVWSNRQIEKALSKKTKLAVQFASHCVTHSLRETLTADIQKYANISTFGSCYGTQTDSFVFSDEIEKHFFYLAFENAVCKDYITEKFWRIKELVVPVVLKRSLLKGIVEDDYFIAADDFNSTQALVEKLVHVSENLTEYKKYLGWTKKYKKTIVFKQHLCKVCEMAVKKEKHFVPNIYQWWENEAECQFNYLNFTLQYLTDINLRRQ